MSDATIPRSTGPARAPAPPSPLPAVIGILILGAAVLVLGLWLGRDGIGTPGGAVPELTLVEPTNGAVVEDGMRLVFEAPGLVNAPEGWRAGRLHLHAVIDGVELMPAAADVEQLEGGRYAWRITPPPPPGRHTILLRWSGPDHAPLAEGATEMVTVEVRGAPGGVQTSAPAPGHQGHTR